MSRNERGVFIREDGTKTFVPLENNPEVLTDLVHRLGMSPQLGFYDIYSIDEPELLALVPKPVHAIIFIAPAGVYYRVRTDDAGGKEFAGAPTSVEQSKKLTYDGSGEEEPVMWFKQTIGHACGLIALLHSVANGSARYFILPGSTLDNLFKEALSLKPHARAQLLYDSEELEKAHMASAFKGDSRAPLASEPNGYHFISFVKGKDSHLYELEGSSDGPIDRGLLDENEDVVSDRALNAGIRRFVKAAEGNLEFSMVALATKPSV
ncbi:hypothetical protein M433DRAFT_149533 [Acidomyces richmondensis BFW]|nr:MAG: hypothetical protein FE78DRAFT_90212 [Acidomyces sp. 'richmondensis']KYG49871.1 hypothetical protein M433DRAFT_149533 [Acidomyces richmondensis BFW]